MLKYSQISSMNTEKNIKLRNSFYDIQLMFESIKIKISNEIIPVVQKFSELLIKALGFLQKHTAILHASLLILTTILAGVFISSLVSATKALARFALAMLANPFTLWTIGIIGLLLLFQDFYVYMNGGDSVFGRMIGKFDQFAERLPKITKKLYEFLMPFPSLIHYIDKLFGIKELQLGLDEDKNSVNDLIGNDDIDSSRAQTKLRIAREATLQGVDPKLAIGVAENESNLNPNAKNPLSSASGIFQLTDATALSSGMKDLSKKNNLSDNIIAGVSNLKKISSGLRQYFGREPTFGEVLIGEKFGLMGSEKIFSAPKNSMLSSLFNDSVMKANPQYKNVTTGQLINNSSKIFDQKSVTVGEVKINAPNSNAREISKKVQTELQRHLSMLVTNSDNGVLA